MEFFQFDGAYVDRLRAGDPTTEQHFVAYFSQLLRIKLRSRSLPSDKIDDLCQDTFVRVIATIRKEGGLRQAESLGAFVNSTCNNVLRESYRSDSRSQPLEDSHMDIPDKVLDIEGYLVTKQSSDHVRRILADLPARDCHLLRAIFLEDKDKDEICREFGVDREYLRVLLHRAKDKFKSLYQKAGFGVAPPAARSGTP